MRLSHAKDALEQVGNLINSILLRKGSEAETLDSEIVSSSSFSKDWARENKGRWPEFDKEKLHHFKTNIIAWYLANSFPPLFDY